MNKTFKPFILLSMITNQIFQSSVYPDFSLRILSFQLMPNWRLVRAAYLINCTVKWIEDYYHVVSPLGGHATLRWMRVIAGCNWAAGEGVALLNGWPHIAQDPGHSVQAKRHCLPLCVLLHESWMFDLNQNAVI